jgi:hypothetical protein
MIRPFYYVMNVARMERSAIRESLALMRLPRISLRFIRATIAAAYAAAFFGGKRP